MLAPLSSFNSNSTLRFNILGLVNFLGCCSKPAYEKVFSKATPSTKRESSIEPPATFLIPINFSSRSSWSKLKTASTTILVKNLEFLSINLDDIAVVAHLSSKLRNSIGSSFFTSTANCFIFSTARSQAVSSPLAIKLEEIPSSMKVLLSFKSSPANIVTEVVPSPTSASWALETSTNIWAAG